MSNEEKDFWRAVFMEAIKKPDYNGDMAANCADKAVNRLRLKASRSAGIHDPAE